MTLDEVIAAHPVLQNVSIGVWVNPGWLPLLAEMAKELATVDRVQLSQVKQKFGGLRVYAQLGSADDGRVDRIIAKFAERADHTCERCGIEGESVERKNGSRGVMTLCPSCALYDGYHL